MDFTFLYIFSWIAFVSTVAPICYKIWKRKSSENFTSVPFMMGVISFWLRYALLKDEATVLKVNIVALSLNTVYLLIYYCYTKKKLKIILLQFRLESNVIATEVLYKTEFTVDILGVCCTLFNIICFGSPLAGLRTVFRQGNCETLPLPMSIGNFIVSSEWFLYGILTENIYIIVSQLLLLYIVVISRLLYSKVIVNYCIIYVFLAYYSNSYFHSILQEFKFFKKMFYFSFKFKI
uniref:Sugar transporter SWEET n=1 Tax=Syphacia muris TaxID=451379 RepID=A0A0N5AMI1_9BILA